MEPTDAQHDENNEKVQKCMNCWPEVSILILPQ
jgi:hypothetical protein